jgi:signal transduction histidine kinase
VNLTINARDALPDGGRIEIGMAEVLGRPADAEGPDTSSERFVRLAVSDTGVGMDDFTRLHAFEPFFTTKPAGRGTGLGLASVYGIVTGAGGVVRLLSEPGHGTCIELLWPAPAGV